MNLLTNLNNARKVLQLIILKQHDIVTIMNFLRRPRLNKNLMQYFINDGLQFGMHSATADTTFDMVQ